MIQGETVSDGVLILQAVEQANLSGLFFLGAHWVRIASGCIVDGSIDTATFSGLLLWDKPRPWKWIRTDDRREGKYFHPVSLVLIGKLDSQRRFLDNALRGT
jgi:hypothetical protein